MKLKHVWGLALTTGLAATPTYAANWLRLQGTEPQRVMGQMEYQATAGSEIAADADADADQRCFTTLTLGSQYFINKTRLMANYEWREATAPGPDDGAVPNRILDELDNLVSLQRQLIFK